MAIYKTLENKIGQTYSYFRIKEIRLDYDNNYVTAVIDVYTSAAQRDKEKEQLTFINNTIKEHDRLKNIKEPTEKEKQLLFELSQQLPELYAKKIERYSLFEKCMPFRIDDDIDLRPVLYERITSEKEFENSQKI